MHTSWSWTLFSNCTIVEMSYVWPFEWHHCRCSLHLPRLFSLGCDLAFGGCQGQVLFVYGVIEWELGSPYTHVGRAEYCKTQAASQPSITTMVSLVYVRACPHGICRRWFLLYPRCLWWWRQEAWTCHAPHSGLSDCILFSWRFLVVYRQQLRLWSDSKEHLGGTPSHRSRHPVLSSIKPLALMSRRASARTIAGL